MSGQMLLDSAEAFGGDLVQYRSELLVHCYRMLGTLDEAEDAVQDALARAWKGRQTFLRSISFRAWLYRIATNICLNAIEVLIVRGAQQPVNELVSFTHLEPPALSF